MQADGENRQGGRGTAIRRHLPLALILAVALIGTLTLRDTLSFETLSANREALIAFRDTHYTATLLVFMAFYAAIVALSLPGGAITSITGGFLFGLFPGTPVNVLAATLGATLLFLAARHGIGAGIARRMDASEGRIRRIKAAVDVNQWEALFLMRLLPAVPFFLANLLPAMFGVPLHRFVITTGLGIIPGALVFTALGAGLSDVLASGEAPDLGILFAPHVLLPILGLAALVALPILVRTIRARRA